MFSLKIVDTDAFLDMPQSSQLLYYSLSMRADDDGFVSNPKKIMRMIGSSEDDYKVLTAKKFIIQFESGVCVIKHWLIHNLLRGDRYTETQYIKEKKQLIIDPNNKKYSLKSNDLNVIPNGNQMAPQVRLGKVRLDKGNNTIAKDKPSQYSKEVSEIIKEFETVDPKNKNYYSNKTQREACKFLIETYTFERTIKAIRYISKIQGKDFAPLITTPCQLRDKWVALENFSAKLKKESNGMLVFKTSDYE